MATKTSKPIAKTVKKNIKSAKSAVKKGKNVSGWFMRSREPSTLNDIKTAVLLVSLTINLIVLILWLVLRLTTAYDQQLFDFFLG